MWLCAAWGRRARDSAAGQFRRVLGAVVLSIGAICVAAAGIDRPTLADRYRTEARQALRSNPDRSLALTADALALQLGDLEAIYLAATAYAPQGRLRLGAGLASPWRRARTKQLPPAHAARRSPPPAW